MNWKKILIMPVSFIAVHFLYVSCCHCVDSNEKFYKIVSLQVTASGSGNTVVDNGNNITVDSINLFYDLQSKCIVNNNSFSAAMVNSAFATTTCDCFSCGYEGLKTKIEKIEITSDSTFNGMLAGTPLNNIFKVKLSNAYNGYEYITLDSIKNRLNENGWRDYLPITTSTKPTDFHGHRFTLTIQTEDSQKVSVTTNRILWY